MARPLRIEFPGTLYHVTSRGDRRESIFSDDENRVALLGIVAQGLERFDAQMLAYCLMGNHYHFVLHTRCANLSRAVGSGLQFEPPCALLKVRACLLRPRRVGSLRPH